MRSNYLLHEGRAPANAAYGWHCEPDRGHGAGLASTEGLPAHVTRGRPVPAPTPAVRAEARSPGVRLPSGPAPVAGPPRRRAVRQSSTGRTATSACRPGSPSPPASPGGRTCLAAERPTAGKARPRQVRQLAAAAVRPTRTRHHRRSGVPMPGPRLGSPGGDLVDGGVVGVEPPPVRGQYFQGAEAMSLTAVDQL